MQILNTFPKGGRNFFQIFKKQVTFLGFCRKARFILEQLDKMLEKIEKTEK
jgi:hypothetical protein